MKNYPEFQSQFMRDTAAKDWLCEDKLLKPELYFHLAGWLAAVCVVVWMVWR